MECLSCTFFSSCGEGYAARMAEAMSWLTLFNCCICLFHTCSRPFPLLSTRWPPAHSLSKQKEKPDFSFWCLKWPSEAKITSSKIRKDRHIWLQTHGLLVRDFCNCFGCHGDVIREILPGGKEADWDASVKLQMHCCLMDNTMNHWSWPLCVFSILKDGW